MNFFIIGGGITGLIAAYRLKLKHPNACIKLIESDTKLGGLLSGFTYKNGLYFDTGTHIFQETGLEDLDQILIESIKSDELIHFPKGEGDIAGCLFNGRIQIHSHIPDLRDCANYESLIYSLNQHINNLKNHHLDINRSESLVDQAVMRFGKQYTEKLLLPIFKNLYTIPSDQLSGFAMLLPGLTRVIINDFEDWIQRSSHDSYRSVIGIPHRDDLPEKYRHNRRSYYSKSGGTSTFISGIIQRLKSLDIQILLDTKIVEIDYSKNQLTYKADDSIYVNHYDGVVIATGVVPAAFLFKVDLKQFKLDRPMSQYLIHLVLDKPSKNDLFYFYGLDLDCDWYRITNYRPITGNPNDCRLTIEIIGREIISNDDFINKIISQLFKLGFLHNKTIKFYDVIKLKSGFPKPTTTNMIGLNALGKSLCSLLPSNLLLAGIGARENRFFQNEIMMDVYEQVDQTF